LADNQLQLFCNKWKEITNLKEIPNTGDVYLLLEPTTESSNVFGHWIGEAFIFIPTLIKLLSLLPNLKVVISGYKGFKAKILQHYHVPFVVIDGQFTEFRNPNNSIEKVLLYPMFSNNRPAYLGVMPLITSEHNADWLSFYFELATKFYYFIDRGLPPNPLKNINVSYFPRHKTGNFPIHDRTYMDDDLLVYLSNRCNCVIAESQNLTWEQELDILSRSKIIIVPDGSALVATLYARNSTIIVLGSVFSFTASKLRPKVNFLYRLIEKTNRIFFVGKNNTEDFLKDLMPLLDYSIITASR
jgi:hypothetical protein